MDRLRPVVVAVCAVIALLVSLIGSGAFVGTPINEAADGALSAEATLVAPAGPAFSIWSVIYVGLIGLAVLQALPGRREDPRQRRVGWLVAASMLLNAAWIGCAQLGWLIGTALTIVALLAVLVVAFLRLREAGPRSWTERILVDGVMGLYLGWVSIATVANLAAVFADAGAPRVGPAATGWAAVVLGVAAAVGVALAVAGRGRWAPAVALAWGLAWVAAGRSTGEPRAEVVAVLAAVAAAVVLLGTGVARRRSAAGPAAVG